MSWVAVGSAAASIGGSLLSKKSSKTKDPKYLRQAKEGLVSRSTELSNRPYREYGGERVAGLSDNEKKALGIAGSTSADARRDFGKAESALDASTTEYSTSALDKYKNPYVDAVLQPQIREQNKQYEQAKTALGNSKAGAFGGDRQALARSALEKNQMEAVNDITGRTYKEAFDAANQNFFNDAQRKQNAASSYQRLGEGVANLDKNDIQNLMATGGVQRLLKQAGLDAKYADFIENRDWDVNNLDTLIKGIQGASGGNSTTTTKMDRGQVVSNIIGAGATLAGAYFTGKAGELDPVDISGTLGTYGTGTAKND